MAGPGGRCRLAIYHPRQSASSAARRAGVSWRQGDQPAPPLPFVMLHQNLEIEHALDASPLDRLTGHPCPVPIASQVERVLKRYERGEIERVPWLDRLALKAIADLRLRDAAKEAAAEEAARAAGEPSDCPLRRLRLVIELPTFPCAVLHQQQVATAAAHPAAPVAEAALVAAAAAAGSSGSGVPPPGSIVMLFDPELGRDNPCEFKAQKLARGLSRGVVDRGLKPDTEERRRIAAVLALPPNRPLSADDRALLWRFRFALTSDPRALTKFLKASRRSAIRRWARPAGTTRCCHCRHSHRSRCCCPRHIYHRLTPRPPPHTPPVRRLGRRQRGAAGGGADGQLGAHRRGRRARAAVG